MTEKENFIRVLRGEEPAWVPRYNMGPTPFGMKAAVASAVIEPLMGTANPDGSRVDIWGVEYTPTDSTDGMALPTPGKFILKDITKWRDVIKAPDLSHVDWEMVAKKSVENIDRNETAVSLMGGGAGFFMALMNFMGFTEGLLAMAEAPDDVYELFDYMASFYEEPIKKLVHYIKPELFSIGDDTATAKNPFISPNMYRELVKPFHARMAKIATDAGIPVDMHCCGHCEVFIEDWLDFGVRSWNPAQIMNDLVGIKKKYGNRLVLIGCWDSSGPASWPDATEELVRAEVRKTIDTYAPGGGFMFWGSVYGAKGDERAKQRAEWVTDEYDKYGRTFYQRAH